MDKRYMKDKIEVMKRDVDWLEIVVTDEHFDMENLELYASHIMEALDSIIREANKNV